MEFTAAKILQLTRQLYPRGRAFKMAVDSYLESFHKGIAESEKRFYNDSISILDTIIPDNDNFTEEDARDWEIRLGLIVNDSLDLESRKLAIKQKLNYPGTTSGRQSAAFLQKVLNDAGFDVYVHENNPTQDPDFWTDWEFDEIEFGEYEMHGKIQEGKIIANHINEAQDSLFAVGSNLKFTFFIGGENIGDIADVDILRKDEFRQLILKVKPAHTVGLLYINYV